MPKPGWLNENEHRAFPLLNGSDQYFADSIVVDANFSMGQSSGYIEGQHTVWLEEISRSGDTFTFVVRTDAPGASSKDLVFTRDINDKNAVEHVKEVYEG